MALSRIWQTHVMVEAIQYNHIQLDSCVLSEHKWLDRKSLFDTNTTCKHGKFLHIKARRPDVWKLTVGWQLDNRGWF